jgi:hypothetical protein
LSADLNMARIVLERCAEALRMVQTVNPELYRMLPVTLSAVTGAAKDLRAAETPKSEPHA